MSVGIDRLRKLHEAATPGPWVWRMEQTDRPLVEGPWGRPGEYLFIAGRGSYDRADGYGMAHTDARLVAEMRNALPVLLDELAATRARLAAAETALANVGIAPQYPLVRCYECGGTGVLEVEPIRPTDWRDELDAPDEEAGE